MIRDWLHDIHVLINEEDSNFIFSYHGKEVIIEKERVERACIKESMNLYEQIVNKLEHKHFSFGD